MTDIAVLGAGAFGTALAISLAAHGRHVTLIPRDESHARDMAQARENRRRLPGHPLPDGLDVSLTLPDPARIVLAAVPTQALGAYLAPMAAELAGCNIVACNKGIDMASGLGPTGIIANACPQSNPAILSGPSFAVDIAAGLPTALTIAAADEDRVADLQSALSTANLRLYRTTDVAGVEIGGALKNVIAIAAGIAIGAKLGESARASLVTRGYAELARFAASRGARPETLAGLSGLGDLILTCTSEKSRNFGYGLQIGRGDGVATTKTVEGAATARVVSKLAESAGISVPITDLVGAILDERIDVTAARDALLSRPLKKE